MVRYYWETHIQYIPSCGTLYAGLHVCCYMSEKVETENLKSNQREVSQKLNIHPEQCQHVLVISLAGAHTLTGYSSTHAVMTPYPSNKQTNKHTHTHALRIHCITRVEMVMEKQLRRTSLMRGKCGTQMETHIHANNSRRQQSQV